MRDVAIVATAQMISEAKTSKTTVEMLVPVVTELLTRAGLKRTEVGFWCHGSCDYMSGQPFSFVAAVDALGAWPPIAESHVEADGAFALYEAWIKIQTGECETAVVFSNGKTSAGPIEKIMAYQLDPYTVAPLSPDMHAVAALAARACIETGVVTERAMAEVVSRSLNAGISNPYALRRGTVSADQLLDNPYTYDPLRELDCPPVTDGANAVVLAAGDTARALCARPAWIRGIDHRIANQRFDLASMTSAGSAAIAGERAGVRNDRLDFAELHAPYSHQELLLAQALGIHPTLTSINPSGGALCANPQMAAGLARFADAAERIMRGEADRGVAHCTSGPNLQQNLVAVLEGS